MKTIKYLIFICTVASSIYRKSCATVNEEYEFRWQTVAVAPLSANVVTISHFEEVEERLKLCFYAMMASDLPYIDYNYVPQWSHAYVEVVSPYPPRIPMNYGLKCATLPTIYIVRETWSKILQITSVQSLVQQYTFDGEIIQVNNVIQKEKNSNNASNGACLVDLDMEDRRNLCDIARKYVGPTSLHFLHRDVAEAQLYEFEYRSGSREIDTAIACPTLPHLYLRHFEEKIKLMLLPSFVGDVELKEENVKPVKISLLSEESTGNTLSRLNPEERVNLCNIARRSKIWSLVPFVEDTNAEAHVYLFQYSSRRKIPATAVFCPALPQMYLRLKNSTTKTNIIITFLQNQADHTSYTLELFEDIQPINNVEIREAHRKKMEIERHLFTRVGKSTMWSFCFVAQKYLLKMEDIIFRFTERQSFFWKPKILLIPTSMEEPRLYKLKRSPTVIYEDFIIKCSTWPAMYLRLGDSDTHIRTMLLRKSLVQTFSGKIVSETSTSKRATSAKLSNVTRAFMNLFSPRETNDKKKKE